MAEFSPAQARCPLLDADLPAEPQNEQEARQVLEAIQSSKGYLSPAAREFIRKAPLSTQKEIERGYSSLQKGAAAFTEMQVPCKRGTPFLRTDDQSIVTQNTSPFRFFYELLRNADDAVYNKEQVIPTITFIIRPTTITIETNEVGFRRRNVEAICSTGRSSKKAPINDEHIAEKGPGFKSVFTVAKRVQIRSGPWSFHFDHAEDNPGLGMVTPIIDDLSPLPAEVGTRITLTLNDAHCNEYARLVDEFDSLSNTTFLFLQQLSKVEIRRHSDDGSERRVTYTRETSPGSMRSIKSTGVTAKDETEAVEQTYQIFERRVSPLPPDNRRRGKTAAPLVLAFPTDAQGLVAQLDTRGQCYFAFLPLCRMPPLQVR